MEDWLIRKIIRLLPGRLLVYKNNDLVFPWRDILGNLYRKLPVVVDCSFGLNPSHVYPRFYWPSALFYTQGL